MIKAAPAVVPAYIESSLLPDSFVEKHFFQQMIPASYKLCGQILALYRKRGRIKVSIPYLLLIWSGIPSFAQACLTVSTTRSWEIK